MEENKKWRSLVVIFVFNIQKKYRHYGSPISIKYYEQKHDPKRFSFIFKMQ